MKLLKILGSLVLVLLVGTASIGLYIGYPSIKATINGDPLAYTVNDLKNGIEQGYINGQKENAELLANLEKSIKDLQNTVAEQNEQINNLENQLSETQPTNPDYCSVLFLKNNGTEVFDSVYVPNGECITYQPELYWNGRFNNGMHTWTADGVTPFDFENTPITTDLRLTALWTDENLIETGLYIYGKDSGFSNSNIWTDGIDTYYSATRHNSNDNTYFRYSYVLDQNTATWTPLQINFPDDYTLGFNGYNIWTDGVNIYHTITYPSEVNLVWCRETLTWQEIDIDNNIEYFAPSYIWSDGTHAYYDKGLYYSQQEHYVFDSELKCWVENENPLVLDGTLITHIGKDIYYIENRQIPYVLDKTTNEWVATNWTGLTSYGINTIFTDGNDLYIFNGENYILDQETNEWVKITCPNGCGLSASVWVNNGQIYFYVSEGRFLKMTYEVAVCD